MTTAHACLDRIACLGIGIKYHPSSIKCHPLLFAARPLPCAPYEPSSGMPNLLKCASTLRALVSTMLARVRTMLALEQLSPMRAQVTRQLGNQLRFSCASLGLHLPLLPYPCPYTSILHLMTVLALGIIAPSLWASLSQRSALAPLCHCAARPCPPILWAYFHDARMLL